MNIWGHFRTITQHKLLVMKACFYVGLYKQGLLHDLSKYSPSEFGVGCRYFQGTRSPIMHSGKQKGVLLHGCTIKDVINITMNTGWITVPVRKTGFAE